MRDKFEKRLDSPDSGSPAGPDGAPGLPNDPDTIRIVARALDLRGEERRSYLHKQSGGDSSRYDELVRLVHWSELDPLAHTGGLSLDSTLNIAQELASSWSDVRARLERLGPRPDSVRVGDLIATGGMGRIEEAWDPLLQRTVAVKSIRKDAAHAAVSEEGLDHAALLRFVEEARITGQLDHPGIVPVHTLGLDDSNRVYFTMRRVRGLTLATIFERLHAADEEWTTSRVLGVLQRVCEAMAYAHDKGVVHRDLKPANIMAGGFGEVHVMDWGVARVMEETAERERLEEGSAQPRPTGEEDKEPGSGIVLTQDGDVLGTPAYMSPEQAAGNLDELGPRSDVYSVGAMLYQLLTGFAPYSQEPKAAHVLVARVLREPPAAIESSNDSAPAELVSICNKSMARDPSERYADMGEMARDLTAFLEDRVVRAHKVGALIELRKWVQRNKRFAAALLALVVFLPSAMGWIAVAENRRAAEAQRSIDMALAVRLEREFEGLGSVIAQEGPAEREAWLLEVEGLLERAPTYEQELRSLQARGSQRQDPLEGLPDVERAELSNLEYWLEEREKHIEEKLAAIEVSDGERLDRLERELDFLEPHFASERARFEHMKELAHSSFTHVFESSVDQERHDSLVRFRLSVERLQREDTGLVARARMEIDEGLRIRNRSAAAIEEAWRETLRSIADESENPIYGGAQLDPIPGLIPIGRDPTSGLFELWHELSGTEPRRDDLGEIIFEDEAGLVFVLVPGGTCPAEYDENGLVATRETRLDPFLLSKFEMTQGQWFRLTGRKESYVQDGFDLKRDGLAMPGHPVESISWVEAKAALARWSLALPTSAQWVHAARGGDVAMSWPGDGWAARLIMNVTKNSKVEVPEGTLLPPNGDPDGFIFHARIGSYPPNPFGFHEILGNVAELCEDWATLKIEQASPRAGDGLVDTTGYTLAKIVRGGSSRSYMATVLQNAPSSVAYDERVNYIGIRPIAISGLSQ